MQTIKFLRFFAPAFLFCVSLASCKNNNGLRGETIRSASGWGYNILMNGRILIHQESIPGQADTKGFDTQAQANAMAKLVVQKMEGGGFPSVTSEEVMKIKKEGEEIKRKTK